MNATVEIDKAGRIVVPKRMRDALRLHGGQRLRIVCNGERLTVEPEDDGPELCEEGGWLVIRATGPRTTVEDIERLRIDEERDAMLMGKRR